MWHLIFFLKSILIAVIKVVPDYITTDAFNTIPIQDYATKKKKPKKKKRNCNSKTTVLVSQPGRNQFNIDVIINNNKNFKKYHSPLEMSCELKMAAKDKNGAFASFYNIKVGQNCFFELGDFQAKFFKHGTTSQECRLSIRDFCSFLASCMGLQSKMHDEIEQFYVTDKLPDCQVLAITPSMGAFISGERADVSK